MLGERFGHVVGAHHHRVVVVVDAVGRIGVRQVGDAQQQIAQRSGHFVGLGGQRLLLLAQFAARRLQCLGTCRVAVAPLLADLLRQVVDLGTNGIAPRLQGARTTLEFDGLIDLHEQFGLVAAGERGPHTSGVEAQKSDVDHVVQASGPTPLNFQG
jgi:hypothetical protein